jgi:hypothetical protein
MIMKPHSYLLAAAIFLCSCSGRNMPSYAIRDFDLLLQPYLTKAIGTAVVGFDTATLYIENHATDDQITRLSQAESPMLRAIALREMIRRPGFNHFNVIMSHLDDTAMIAWDAGEWGIKFHTVSDDVISNGTWKTKADHDKTADEIIRKHDYLAEACTALDFMPLKPEYYPHLKVMVLRDRPFEQIERALFALAKYKKMADIPVISQLLAQNAWEMSHVSFGLMENFPDTAYLEILTKYYPRRFYRKICADQQVETSTSYIDALASYKTERSARILTAMLDRKPFAPCAADTFTIKYAVLRAIWNNSCPAYAIMRTRISAIMHEIIRRDTTDTIPIELIPQPVFPEPGAPVRW